MKIVFAATPIGGHVNPLLGMMQFLTQSGHDVVGYTGSTLRDAVESTGATFRPLPPDVDFDLRDVDKSFPERTAYAPGMARLFYDISTFFLRPIASQYHGLEQLVRDFDADVVVYEHLFYGAVPLLLKERKDRPAMIGCGVTYLRTPRQDGAPDGPALPFATDEATRQVYVEKAFPEATAAMAPVQELYDAVLRKLGFEKHASRHETSTTLLADAFWQTTVPSFDYPQDQGGAITFIGAAPQIPSTTPLPYWADELGDFRRVVLVTQGTVANSDFETLVVPSLAALADEPDTLVLVTTGGRALSDFSLKLPANARIAAYLPFDWLMPKIDLLITNGGYGTVNQALAAGVPIVVAGETEDKPEVAARIAWAGVGIDLKTGTPTAEAIRDAARRIFGNPEFARRSAEIASEFRRYDSTTIVRQTLDRLADNRQVALTRPR